MSDSPRDRRLAEKHERNRRERFAAVDRWVEYIKEQPPEVWGPQQNAVVNAQLESAQAADLSVEHEQAVRAFAAGVLTDEQPGEGPDTDGE